MFCPSPSLPAPPRSASTSCPTSPPWTSSTFSPNTSAAPRASRMRMAAAAPQPCGRARGASGGPASPNCKRAWGLVHRETPVPVNRQRTGQTGLLSHSPGRSPSSYDNEIVMMNHVYKERFPKVRRVGGGWLRGGWAAAAPLALAPRVPWWPARSAQAPAPPRAQPSPALTLPGLPPPAGHRADGGEAA